MCTGGRIRLFWGVSPDIMALALITSYTFVFLHIVRFCVIHTKTHDVEKNDELMDPKYNIYIYIYI